MNIEINLARYLESNYIKEHNRHIKHIYIELNSIPPYITMYDYMMKRTIVKT